MFEGGGGSAAGLDGLMPAGLGEPALVDAIAGWDRLVSWAPARQLAAIEELARPRLGLALIWLIGRRPGTR